MEAALHRGRRRRRGAAVAKRRVRPIARDSRHQRHQRRGQDLAGHAVGDGSGAGPAADRAGGLRPAAARTGRGLGTALGPGVCEALRGHGEITQMVQPTDTEFFSVVTAGSWNRQVLPALANGSIAPLLKQLRESFDFVIIDSSPLLPIVDARLLCQHVDSVLLSVLRDVSEGDKVLAAQEMLDAFGVAHVDAVVTSGEQLGSHKGLLNHAELIDERHARPGDEPSAPLPEEVAAAQGSGPEIG